MDDMWAKTDPYKSLLHHMIDAGCMAEMLLQGGILRPALGRLDALISEHKVLNTAACLIALHDIGKCHPYFQGKAPSLPVIRELNTQGRLSVLQQFPYRHELGGKRILERLLKNKGISSQQLRMMGSVLRLHHQKGAMDAPGLRIPENMDRPYWEGQQRLLFDQVCIVFDPDFKLFEDCTNLNAAAVLLWGCMVLSDWLVSGQQEFSDIDESLPLQEYITTSRRVA